MPTAVSLSLFFIFHDDDAHQNLSDAFCHQILPVLEVVQIGSVCIEPDALFVWKGPLVLLGLADTTRYIVRC